jgi:hypothetical protein
MFGVRPLRQAFGVLRFSQKILASEHGSSARILESEI